MTRSMLDQILSRSIDGGSDAEAWRDFHEASKTSRHGAFPSPQEVARRMAEMAPGFEYLGYPIQPLPPAPPLEGRLSEVMTARRTGRDIGPGPLSAEQLSALLFYSCGVTRDETAAGFPRTFRVTPSAGALYPLELYVHTRDTAAVAAGLHHYEPQRGRLRTLTPGDQTAAVAATLVEPQLAERSSALVFITAVFERATFKYGDRGYRFALLEAGHAAQNLVLTAQALGLGAVTLGGYFDRDADRLLGIDGLEHATIYVIAVGHPTGRDWLGL